MPFKTVLEATCHILLIRSKSPSPAHAQGLWTSAKPSLTPTCLPGRFRVLLPAVRSFLCSSPHYGLRTARPCKQLEERSGGSQRPSEV